jgi:hypothetical protein
MSWLDGGSSSYSREQPPLAQAVVALGPYLKGLRSHKLSNPNVEGNEILYSGGTYSSNLAAARSGNVLFLVLASSVVFLWARRWFGGIAAWLALISFLSLPPILGHTGLATVDMACAATVATALYAFLRCLEEPSLRRLILLGGSLALAFLCKFSSLPFLGACLLCALLYAVIRKGRDSLKALPWRSLSLQVSIVSGVVFLVLWAGYRFSVNPIQVQPGNHELIDRALAKQPLLRSLAHKALETPLPLLQFVSGIKTVGLHNTRGHDSYLLGEYRRTGWWYFFPVVIGVKTPIGFLLLTGCGGFALIRSFPSRPWQQALTVIFPAAIMLVCMSSNINVGVRHILPLYPLLSVIAGYAASELFVLARRKSRAMAIVAILLVASILLDSWRARPDYLAFFNQFAGQHPEKVLVESDLDWGQDLTRLSLRLKERHVNHVAIAYYGVGILENAGLPPFTRLSPHVPTTNGYLAVSVRFLTLDYAKNGSYAWLKDLTPFEKVGKSIYLYYLSQ